MSLPTSVTPPPGRRDAGQEGRREPQQEALGPRQVVHLVIVVALILAVVAVIVLAGGTALLVAGLAMFGAFVAGCGVASAVLR